MHCSGKSSKSGHNRSDVYWESKGTEKGETAHKNKNSSNQQQTSTIFDTPDFVIDAYLDALNGGSSKDAGFRNISDKYKKYTVEGNTNCNHNSKDCPCGQSKDKPDTECFRHDKEGNSKHPPKGHAHCGCNDSIYEEGESPFVEVPKKHCCQDGSPYEKGETPYEEAKKTHICACACDEECGSPYESGAPPFKDNRKPVHPIDPKAMKEKTPSQCDPHHGSMYTLPCGGGPDMELVPENCSLTIDNTSNNNLVDLDSEPSSDVVVFEESEVEAKSCILS